MAEGLEPFLRRLHRRLVVLRAAESTGLGVLGGCVLCLVVVPVLIWRGEAVWGVVGMMLAVGGVLGLTWTVLRPPRLLEAAGVADAQFRLADLLTTAWLVRGDADAMSQSVVAMAAARAALIPPNDVLLNRLGKRAWTGIGLATALVVSMGLLSANPIETSASDRRLNPSATAADPGKKSSAPLARHVPKSPGVFADQPNAGNNALDPAQDTDQGVGGKTADGAGNTPSNPDGSGGGVGTSKEKDPAAPPRTTGTTDPTVAANAGGGTTASGARGGSVSGREGATGQSVRGVQRAAAPPPPPPWSTTTWGESRQAAESAMRDGSLPAEYHDLVRAYFDRR